MKISRERGKYAHGGSFNRKVGEQDELGAFPLFSDGGNFGRLQLPLSEIRDGVDDHPWDAAAEVHNLQSKRTLVHEVRTIYASNKDKLREAGSWQDQSR